jgi:hypothetical protein
MVQKLFPIHWLQFRGEFHDTDEVWKKTVDSARQITNLLHFSTSPSLPGKNGKIIFAG